MQRLRDSAEMLFEPTGDLWKDYSAYCEIEDKAERDDLVDAVHVVELKAPDPAAGTATSKDGQAAGSQPNVLTGSSGSRVQTHFIARNLDYCLAKKDAVPLANAIPHCHTLTKLHLTGCGITEFSLKLFVEAVYKSPSVVSVAVDFNPGGLFKDPTVSKKDRNEVFVSPSHYRGNNQRMLSEEAAPAEKKGGKDKKGADKGKAAAAAAAAEEPEKQPFSLPTGWHALLLTGIQQLSLRGNNITDRQLEPLCSLLENNTELITLSLWGNAITSNGAKMLAKALKSNRRLTALNVGHNQIDDEGVAALAEVLLSMDVSNEEASKLRLRTLRNLPNAGDLPLLPSFADLFVNPAAEVEKKDTKKKDAGKKGKVEGPTEKLKGDFDRDCVRLEESRVRVSGNTSLWCLNLSNNTRITSEGVDAFINVLSAHEPVYEGTPFDGMLPKPYVTPTLTLEQVELSHSSLGADATGRLTAVMDQYSQYRAAAASRQASAS